MTAKEKLRRTIEELSEGEAEAALAFIAERRGSDPLLELFAGAPEDDEPTTAEEDASAEQAWAAHRRGESIPLERARRELA
jgi:hypothetical protein